MREPNGNVVLSSRAALRAENIHNHHGRTRAMLRALAQDLAAVMGELPEGSICDRLAHVCRRDLKRSKEVLL